MDHETNDEIAYIEGGRKYYLLRTRDVAPRSPEYPDDTTYRISTIPGRTNQSGEVVTNGWLGTTGDVAEYADGEYDSYEAALAAIPDGFDRDGLRAGGSAQSNRMAAKQRQYEGRVKQLFNNWTRKMDQQRGF